MQACSVQKRHYLSGWHIERTKGRSQKESTTQLRNEIKKQTTLNTPFNDIGLTASHSEIIVPMEVVPLAVVQVDVNRNNQRQCNGVHSVEKKGSTAVSKAVVTKKNLNETEKKKPLLRSKIAFWMSIIFSFLLLIGPILFVLGTAIHVASIFNIGFWITIFVLWTGWLIIPTTLILANKEARQQKKEQGKKKIFKMLRTGEYKQYQALFARRLMWASLISFLSLFLFVLILAILGIPNS